MNEKVKDPDPDPDPDPDQNKSLTVCQPGRLATLFFSSCLAYLEIGFVLLLSHQKIFQYCGQADKYFSLVRCSCLPSTLDGLRYIHTVYANKKCDRNKKSDPCTRRCTYILYMPYADLTANNFPFMYFQKDSAKPHFYSNIN
jgi:hypothetical protein